MVFLLLHILQYHSNSMEIYLGCNQNRALKVIKVKSQKYLTGFNFITFSVLITLLYIFLCTGQKLWNGKETRPFSPDEALSPAGKPGFLSAHFFVLLKVHFYITQNLKFLNFYNNK